MSEAGVRDATRPGTDFIRSMVAADVAAGRFGGRVVTRFPPEPNGYLHIGHAKAICVDFGVAEEFGGRCHLRMDDTNPETEDVKYVEAIIRDVKWLGFDWGEHLYYASDYFEKFYELAVGLIRKGLAYVDSSSEEEIREARGTVTEPGRPTKYRDRSVEENLDLFRRMRAGEFPDGAHVLRARIDLASPNMLMRDPVLYRIRHASHYRQGDAWCIYPLYDFAHPLEDALECVTHSLCTLEFENNRELYDWVVTNCDVECRPYQTEFARLELDYTITSKRKLLRLVETGHVGGWDDPRMPTLAGIRRRGVPPEAVRTFADMVGVARTNSRVDLGKFEYVIREELNRTAPRVLCVLDPLPVTITNWPAGHVETFDAPYWPHDVPKTGARPVPMSERILIDRADFMEDPPAAFFRLAPGREVRLRHAFVIRCDDVVKDANGEIIELRCSYDPATRGGRTPDNRPVKGTIHWVDAERSLPCEVRLYDRLFRVPEPGTDPDVDFVHELNPDSLIVKTTARIEPSVAADPAGSRYQFERTGYFVSDIVDSRPDRLVFNRTITLRDTWAKISGQQTESSGRPERKRAAAEKAREAPRAAGRAKPAQPAAAAELTARDSDAARLLEEAIAAGADARAATNWINNDIARELAGRPASELPFGGRQLAALLELLADDVVSPNSAREVLAEMVASGGDPAAIVERRGLRQINDEAELARLIADVMQANPDKVEAYRGGRTGLLGFFVGQVMNRTGGRANPEAVRTLLLARLQA